MAGTLMFALLPLYLTTWKDAVYDGALLIIAVAFSSDATFRCLDPANKNGNLTTCFAVGSMVVLALALLQYGSIANDLRKERTAILETLSDVSKGLPLREEVIFDTLPIVRFERERDKDEQELPNSSLTLLIASIIVEFSVIILIEV